MYIGDTYFNLKNLSKNQRKELRELKRLYDEAVASGMKPKSPFGKYQREDERGRVTKQQLDKLQKISYKAIYESMTLREQLQQKGLTNNDKYEKPKFVDPLRYHPEIQVIGGGQLMDIETGEIYEDWADYNRKTEQDFKNKIEDAMKKPKPQVPQTNDVEPPDIEYDTIDDNSDAVKVDNFVEAVSPAYVSKNSSKGTRDAADLASTIRQVEHEYGTKAAAQLIDSIPSDITGKIQNSNSKERYEADQAALEFAYDFLFSHTYDTDDEEWIE